ncbi:hypothetical protein GCM10023165_27340 [Variovorax defluvii]|uniref:Gingipain domain-containing protein n=1 Tax=Variovorax defluvii TaxID=913761 RepID=A0ABP8HTR5_9BURK
MQHTFPFPSPRGLRPSAGRRAARCLLAFTVAILVGCGGGGGGGGLPIAWPQGSAGPDTGANPNPSGAATMSVDERSASTLRVAQKYQALLDSGASKPWEELKAYVLAQPEYQEAEIGNDALWARFKDGRQFLYTDNLRPLPRPLSIGKLAKSTERAGDRAALKTAAANAKGEVPGSDTAVFLAADDQGTFNYGKATQTEVADMLQERGWKIAPQRDLTVDALMSLKGSAIGILYLTAHSAVIGPLFGKEFGVITETLTSDDLDKRYQAELDAGELIYHRSRNLLREVFQDQQRPRYGVTAAFVRKHLNFSPNSLVVMLSCDSGSEEAAGFRSALTDAGAGTIIGWAGSSNDVGHMAMKVMFDRMTAADKVDPKDPPNRAFDLDAVWDYLGKRGYEEGGVAYTSNLLVTPSGEPGGSPAFVKRFGNGFDLTNPVITELEAGWKDKMFVHGNFGTQAGEVSVGGTQVAVSQWGDDRIEVELPTGENDPPGSLGEVVVKARDRTSNKRVLTSWRGKVDYVYETVPYPGTTGTLTSTVTVDLHVRGDAHELRKEVDGTLLRGTRTFVPASDTKVSYRASGTNAGGIITTTWSGSGNIPFKGNALEGNSLVLNGSIDAVGRLFKLSPALLSEDLLDERLTTVAGTTDKKTYLTFYTNALGYTDAFGGDLVSYGTAFPFDAAGNVAPYNKRIAVPTLPADMGWMTVKTGGLTASPAFDDAIGR